MIISLLEYTFFFLRLLFKSPDDEAGHSDSSIEPLSPAFSSQPPAFPAPEPPKDLSTTTPIAEPKETSTPIAAPRRTPTPQRKFSGSRKSSDEKSKSDTSDDDKPKVRSRVPQTVACFYFIEFLNGNREIVNKSKPLFFNFLSNQNC